MELDFSQSILQKQSIIMTKELQQSLKILQMPVQLLEKEVTREFEENPLLDMEEVFTNELDNKVNDRISYKELIKQTEDNIYSNRDYGVERKETFDPYSFIIEEKTLRDFLFEQLIELKLSKGVMSTCRYIVENIDGRGYLACETKDISKELGINEEIVEDCLRIVQTLQPIGIGARSLEECLLIQLREEDYDDDHLYKIVTAYLDYVGDLRLKEISKELNIDLHEVEKYCSIIKRLEPYPARGYYTGDMDSYIVPEAYIRMINGELVIIMNNNNIPTLKINAQYKNLLHNSNSKEICDYIKNKLQSAINLINGIEHRNNTLYRIIEFIIDYQRDYFVSPTNPLKPMSISDIASNLNLHESTISRAIKDKYISTPHTMVLIKDLFTTGLNVTSQEGAISSLTVKSEIEKMINDEDKKKPLSDQNISSNLKTKNIIISRRTVAKYREELGILSSSKRKKMAGIQNWHKN